MIASSISSREDNGKNTDAPLEGLNTWSPKYTNKTGGEQLRSRYQDGERWFYGEMMPGVTLEGVNLSESSLERSDFTGANLRRSNFRKALLNDVDFSGADLRSANLCGADLHQANLSGADLRGANLSGSKVDGASFRNARFDARTRWPKGFDPEAAKAIFVPVKIDRSLSGRIEGRHEEPPTISIAAEKRAFDESR